MNFDFRAKYYSLAKCYLEMLLIYPRTESKNHKGGCFKNSLEKRPCRIIILFIPTINILLTIRLRCKKGVLNHIQL